jgi:hypothetical protein
VHGEGCWSCFDATEQTQPRALMAERAVDLYLLTEPWVFPGEPDAGVATHAAAGLVRGVADGYALLATSWSASDRLGLLLPRRTDAWMTQVRECHIDEWAAEHGCRLTLPEPRLELAHASIEPGPDEQALGDGVFSEENLVRFFLTMAYLYEWLGILTDSPTGRTALTTTNAKNHACSQLLTARKWLRWITRNREEDTGAAAACLYIASHAEIPRYAAPRRRMPSLRELLRESGSYERLVAFAGSLPDWVTEDDQ